jgi:hypothetical protein
MEPVIIASVKHFCNQRSMFHVDGTIMVNRNYAGFMGVHGASALLRLQGATCLENPMVYMTVVSGNMGHEADIREGGGLENAIYARNCYEAAICWRTDEMTNAVRFQITGWGCDIKPVSNEWTVTRRGTVMGRFTWKGIVWNEDMERHWLLKCNEIMAWLSECCKN